MAAVANGSWRLWGREGVVYTERYPDLEVLRRLPSGTLVDGELVVIREGQADFHALMARHRRRRSEEHTSELQSLRHLVCRLLLVMSPPISTLFPYTTLFRSHGCSGEWQLAAVGS